MKLSRWALLLAAAPVIAGCGGLSGAMTAHKDEVARAAGKELKVDEAATLIASNPQLEPNAELVRQVAELWVDYVLLATALAEDSTLAVLDVDKLIKPEREQQTIRRLLEQSVRADTSLTEAELQAAWNTEGPGMEVRARHVLFQLPADANPTQRDSVKRLAEQVRARAAGGEDFAQLAQQFSQDPSAQQGGDLGFFGRGRMVPSFEEAAFALQPGQVSPVVESPFGYHVIKLEERRQRELGEDAERFRAYLQQRAQQEAMQNYVKALTDRAGLKVQPGAAEQVREMAKQPGLALRGRAAERKLVEYEGGALTAAEVHEAMQSAGPQVLGQVAEAPDSALNQVLEGQAGQEVLLAEARRRNVGLSQAEVDSLRSQARGIIRQLTAATGLQGQSRIPKGSAGTPIIEQRVRELMGQAITGQRQMPPLGPLGTQLREIYGHSINESSFQRVIDKIKSIRALRPTPQAPVGQPGQQPPAPMPPPQAAPPPAGEAPKQ